MNRLIPFLLIPLSLLYNGITWLRNLLYDAGILKVIEFEIPVISVGNIRVGGTGKTPVVAYLMEFLSDKYPVAALSRGYGRKTSGFAEVTPNDSTRSVGDEALMLRKKFDDKYGVYVCEDRAFAIPHILFDRPDTGAIILDDAFQHRRVKRDINILLSDFKHLFYRDFVLPAGRLREGRYAAKRSDCVMITKCPENLSDKLKKEIEKNVIRHTKRDTPVFFSSISYKKPEPVFKIKEECGEDIILFTGIADPEPLIEYANDKFNVIKYLKFADHHEFSIWEIRKMIHNNRMNLMNGASLVCTEKDMVRLLRSEIKDLMEDIPVYYIPIKINILGNLSDFNSLVLKKIEMSKGVV